MPEDRAPAPLVTEAEAARLAREVYGVRGQVRTLPGEYDHNFHIVTDAGPGFVLKVMHPARERALLDLQVAALSHLARRAPDLGPRVRETRGGEALTVQGVAQGPPRLVWMVDYRPGSTLAEARPRSPELLESLGRLLGRLDAALADFEHLGAERVFKWDMSRAGWIAGALAQVEPAPRRALLERALAWYEAEVVPALPHLRRSVIHGDANDHNVIVGPARPGPREVVAVVDFGDMHRGLVSAEPAVAAAYALLGSRDPLAAAARVVAGYHAAFPLRDDEIARLWPLIVMRLAVSVINSAASRRSRPGEAYLAVSEGPAWEALERLDAVHPRFAHYTLRAACGLEAVPDGGPVREWLASQTARAAPVLDTDLRTEPCVVIDLGVGSRFLGADPGAGATGPASVAINRRMDEAGARVAIGRYGEVRALYTSPLFGTGEPGGERRTVHLAIDLFAAAGTPVHAPLEGSVQALGNNPASQDYGPLVILRHETPSGRAFFTLYGHLSEDTLQGLAVGRRVARGERIGRVGSPPANGDWPPHVHFQIILDLLDETADYPGVARATERIVWMSLSPDPNLLLGIPAHRFPPPDPTPEETLAQRRAHLGGNLRLSYRRPLEIVRGFMQHLYDRDGRAYLDFFNNVPIVGHSHPRVVRPVIEQLALLNTNTRYLHELTARYAARLTALLPAPLRVCFFLSSGSEANELALRLARAHTGRADLVVLEHAYHGNTNAMIDASPYKFAGPGGRGRPPWVHIAALPDDYRGPYRRGDADAGASYAADVGRIVRDLAAEGHAPAAFLAESLPSVAGQIVLPPGYLSEAYAQVRAAGGLCIADEVQTGFARPGEHFWVFEAQGVVPDVVVLGKPIGNGFPLAAVVTSAEIARSFDNGMEFFSTFGGNPVACAAGMAVLDVVEEDGLQERARRLGAHLMTRLRGVAERQPLIGDVRGMGLFLGVDLVRDRQRREPATEEAEYVVNRLRERGVLTGTDGPHHNVLKLRPPLVITEEDADVFVAALEDVLQEDGAQPGP
jgi:4-aminobutyrate aminotransferase-like enzyme/Ser/Thr protein kinase RdoA (MazF antagonist)